MDVTLVWEKGGKRKQVFHLQGDEMVIGRQLGSGLRIPSADVSRVHCRICREEGYITVEDCASANGTLVNGQTIDGRQILYPGDRLGVGPVTLTVEYQMTQETLDRLQGQEEEVVEELPLEDEELVVAPADEDAELEVAPALEEDELEVAPVDVDDAEPWQLPAPDDLRDILSQLEDSEN
jgi:pSer/pThr/pTyr-binding forkhead associated (FHA) protein